MPWTHPCGQPTRNAPLRRNDGAALTPYAGYMAGEGRADVEIKADVRDFARQAEKDLNSALAKIDLDDVEVSADVDSARKSGEDAGEALGDGITRGADGRLRNSRGKFVKMGQDTGEALGKGIGDGAEKSKGRISSFLKKAFTPDKQMFDSLRAPFAAALSSPIGAAMATVAGTAALAFVGAFAAAIATAGLGAVFLGIGAAALFGAKQSRDDAQKDLDAAEESVRKAEQRAKSGTATSKRSLADARAELAKAKAAVEDNAAFVKLDSSLAKLGNTLKNVGKSAAAPLIGPFTAALNLLSEKALALTPVLHNIFSQLAPTIVPLTDGMAGFVEEFLKVLSQDPRTLEGMRDALIAVGQNLPKLGTALGQFFALLASNENNVRNIGILFDLVASSITNLGLAFYGLSKVMDGIIIAWHAIEDVTGSAVEWITGTAIPAITGAVSAVGNFFSAIPGVISSAWSSIVSFFSGIISSVANFISSVASSVVGFFTSLPDRVISAITALPGMISSFFSTLFSNLAYIIGFGVGSVVSFFAQLPGRIVAAISTLVAVVGNIFRSVWNTARSIVSSGIAAVVGFFTQLPGRIRSAISSLVSVVSSVFSSARSSAQSQSTSLVNGAISIIKNLPGRIRSALSAVRSAVTGAFSGAGSWLVSAGYNIIAGVKNGIANAIGGAVAAARSAASRIVQGFKDALNIGSPSKLMNLEVGRMIPAGAAEGIRDNMGVVDKEIRKITQLASLSDLPSFTVPSGTSRGGDGAALAGGSLQVTLQPGAIVINGQGADAGQRAAEAVLERLGQARGLM